MRKVITIGLLCVGLLVGYGPRVWAQIVGTAERAEDFKKVGGAGAQFLKIGIGAREAAMGGAAAAVSSGLSAVHWNPAGVADIRGISGMFATTRWIGDFTHNFFAVGLPIADGYAAQLSVVSLTSGPIPVTTIVNDKGTGAFYEVADIAVGATIGGYLSEHFSFGLTFKFISQSISDMNSTGFAFDMGTLYQMRQFNDLRFGFAVSNLGPEMRYGGGELLTTVNPAPGLRYRPVDVAMMTHPYALPLYVRAGVSIDALHGIEDHSLLVAGEFITFSDTPEQFIVGAEYGWKELVFLRGGYKFGHEQFGFSGGAGIQYDGGDMQGAIDYAFTMTKSLGVVHRVTVRINSF